MTKILENWYVKKLKPHKPHRGIILLRFIDERSKNKIAVLDRLLNIHSDVLENNFVIVTEEIIRVIR